MSEDMLRCLCRVAELNRAVAYLATDLLNVEHDDGNLAVAIRTLAKGAHDVADEQPRKLGDPGYGYLLRDEKGGADATS